MIVGICGWLVVSYTSYLQSSAAPKKATTNNLNTEEVSVVEPLQDWVAILEDERRVDLEKMRALQIQLRILQEEMQKRIQEDAVILPGSEIRPLRAPLDYEHSDTPLLPPQAGNQ